MWIPKTEGELLSAISTGNLVETATFDAKREISNSSREIAKDVAAMANDGGVLLYGLGEDDKKRLTLAMPFQLAGVKERLAAIIRTCLAEPPVVDIAEIPSEKDASIGYVAMVVPPSPRAPHMVIVDKEMRYYGRTPAGNAPLTEGEVARLYERRRRWERELGILLDDVIQHAPVRADEDYAYLHMISRPVISGSNLLERAKAPGPVPVMLNDLLRRATRTKALATVGDYYPSFTEQQPWYRQPDGWTAYFLADPAQRPNRLPYEAFDLEIRADGTGRLFCYRAAERKERHFLLFELLIADMTARFLSMLGDLYDRAGYLGPVEVGIAITGLKGAIPSGEFHPALQNLLRPLDVEEYRRTERVMAGSLLNNYVDVTRQLTMPLFDAANQGTYNPFSAAAEKA